MTTPSWGDQPPEPTNPYGAPQPSPYQPYGGAGSPYSGYPTVPRTNGLSIASLAVSIGGIPLCCGMSGVVGAILGHVSRGQIRDNPNQAGDGMALAGIIIGWVSFGLFLASAVAYIAFIAILASSADDEHCYTDSYGEEFCY